MVETGAGPVLEGDDSLQDPAFDAAQQSLAEALRTSFRILKLAMVVLVVLYFVSGIFTVEQNREAVVLRMGRLTGDVRGPGVHWAFPPPIDQVVEIPVRQSTTLTVDSHWLFLNDREKNLPLSEIERSGRRGLHPVRDGSLLTGDRGLVHVKWRVTYGVEDLKRYVRYVSDEDYTRAEASQAQAVITKLLERAAIEVVGGVSTEATRKRLNDLRDRVKRLVNEGLQTLGTGIRVEAIEIPLSTPPLQTKLAFDQVIRAESKKQKTVREAQQKAAEMLNQVAGAAHRQLIVLLDRYDALQAAGKEDEAQEVMAEIDRVLEFDASGRAGSMIREAKGYLTTVVQQMRADAERYDGLLSEWRSRPDVLVARLWEQTKQKLFQTPEITKLYRSPGARFRLLIGRDPRERERRERERYMREAESLIRTPTEEMEVKITGGKVN